MACTQIRETVSISDQDLSQSFYSLPQKLLLGLKFLVPQFLYHFLCILITTIKIFIPGVDNL